MARFSTNIGEVLHKLSEISPENFKFKQRVANVFSTAMDIPTQRAKLRVLQSMYNSRGTASKIRNALEVKSYTGKRKGFVATATTGMKDITSGKGQTISIQSVEWGQKSNRFTRRGRNTGRIGSNKHEYRTGWYSDTFYKSIPSIENHALRGINQLIDSVTNDKIIY